MTTLTETAVRLLGEMVKELETEERKEYRAQNMWGTNRHLRLELINAIAQVEIAKELQRIRTILEEKELRIIVAWEPPE